MDQFWPFIVSGIATGAIYGLVGSGLVLTYKTSGIFNFAHGAIATVAAYVFYFLYIEHGWDWRIAAVVAVLVIGPLIGLVMERMARKLSMQRTAYKIVGTIGIILLVQGLATVRYGEDPRQIPSFLPKGTDVFRIGGVNVTWDYVQVTVIALLVVAALYALFRFTRLGIAMRAVVDDPDLVAMYGTSPTRIRRVSWIIGATFAALGGVMVVPLGVSLDSITLTFLVVQAFGAAAFGAFSSIPLTIVGGIVIGVASDLSKKYVINTEWLSGLPPSLPFLALFAVLLLLPRRKLVPSGVTEARPPLQWRAPVEVRLVVGAVVLVGLLLVPELVGVNLSYWTHALVQIILVLSLGLLVRTAGLVSLCHIAFAAIGAAVFSQLAYEQGWPWFVAFAAATLVVVPVGAIVAIPAIRLSGLFLALATLGFGIMVERFFYPLTVLFRRDAAGRPIPRPDGFTSETQYYFLVLGFVVLTALVMVFIHRARLGRILRGMADSPLALSTLGLSTNTTRVLVFCITAMFAAMGGILYGGLVVVATSADRFYGSFNSIVLLAVMALAPFAEPWFALVAAVGIVVPAYLQGEDTTYWLNALFGLFAILVALEGGPISAPAKVRAFFDRFGRKRPARTAAELPPPPIERAADRGGLEVHDLTVRFGGLVAVKDLSFTAPTNRITGLIGPNGAGKTTTFDACSGINRRFSGQVLLHGQDVSRSSPAVRGRKGLGRTFQRVQLCETLSVAENVALGREAGLAGANVLSQLAARPSERRATEAAALHAMELCGISHLAKAQAGSLSTGQRRLVELARCLAGPFDMLLLDEPSSGLDKEETHRFGEVLRNVVSERGCGILLVEHDMSLVMRVCSYIYVLDFGELLFEGEPAAVAASQVVQAAYLGSDAVAPIELQEETL